MLGAADKAATGQFAVHYWGITTLVMHMLRFLDFHRAIRVFLFAVRDVSARGQNVFYSRSESILFANRNILHFRGLIVSLVHSIRG